MIISTPLVDALAAYRVTRLVVEDGITAPLRIRAWERVGYPDQSALGYALDCPHCVGVWAAGTVLLLPRPLRYALALAAVVSLLADLRAWAQVGTYNPDNTEGPEVISIRPES